MIKDSFSLKELVNEPAYNITYVTKRDGRIVPVSFDKISHRIQKMSYDNKQFGNLKDRIPILYNINPEEISKLVTQRIVQNITTQELDLFTASICSDKGADNPDYLHLAARILISNHQKNTQHLGKFSSLIKHLMNHSLQFTTDRPIIDVKLAQFIEENAERIDNHIDYNRDYLIPYFGFCTLQGKYFLHVDSDPVTREKYPVGSTRWISERPQDLFMRVALFLCQRNIDRGLKIYDMLSNQYYTHATPTLYNAGTPFPQLASCFLVGCPRDSINGIYDTLQKCAIISKYAGGIGVNIHDIRSKNSYIYGTNGTSNGIIPMLRVFNNTARYVDQCLLPETYVYTTQGPMQIQHANSHDTEILNKQGKSEKIENVLEHAYDGGLIEIKSLYSIDSLCLTEEHPVLILKKENAYTTQLSRHMEFVEAKEIHVGDYLVHKIPTYYQDVETLNEMDCLMYGILLGNGHMPNYGVFGYVEIFKKNEKEEKNQALQFVKSYLESKFVPYTLDESNHETKISWKKTIEMPFRYSDLYNVKHEKCISNKWLHLPIHKAKYIIKGLLFQCVTETEKEWTFTFPIDYHLPSFLRTRLLVEGIRYLLLRLGILPSFISINKGNDKVLQILKTKRNQTCLKFVKEEEEVKNEVKNEEEEILPMNDDYFESDEYLFSPIESIEQIQYYGTLYDLQMTHEHNYMIHNGIVHNGGGKRKGSIAVYLEPWHADIEDFLMLRRNSGDPEERCRDLFNALWIPDLFMVRVERGEMWSLFDPAVCSRLADTYGEEFDALFLEYESKKMFVKQIPAIDLWHLILQSQIETGQPYVLFKDACNYKSNQKNLGTIRSSNLCTEIIEYSSDDETAVCNLASINLKLCVKEKNPFNLETIQHITVYSVDNCPYCKLAIQFLKRKILKAMEREGENDASSCGQQFFNIIKLCSQEEKDQFKQKLGVENVTFPKIFITSKEKKEKEQGERQEAEEKEVVSIIGGYDELVKEYGLEFDRSILEKSTRSVTRNLNEVIDVSFYPIESCKKSNKRHRPIGIGVQGLADLFFLLKIPFHSDEARRINHEIFECMYYCAMDESCEMAKERTKLFNDATELICKLFNKTSISEIPKMMYDANYYDGNQTVDTTDMNKLKTILTTLSFDYDYDHDHLDGKYQTFEGSPLSKGKFQFDLWDDFYAYRKNQYGISSQLNATTFPFYYDFDSLREKVMTHGVRNSLLMAPMPTASTSQILGNNECIEAITNNYYVRKTLSGDFYVVNNYLISDLMDLELWDRSMKEKIIKNRGSVQELSIPSELKEIYRTVYELPKKAIINMAADRGKFVCQSQSMNLHVANTSLSNISKIHFMSFYRGLKTGMYYLHTIPVAEAGQFTTSITSTSSASSSTSSSHEVCESCSA